MILPPGRSSGALQCLTQLSPKSVIGKTNAYCTQKNGLWGSTLSLALFMWECAARSTLFILKMWGFFCLFLLKEKILGRKWSARRRKEKGFGKAPSDGAPPPAVRGHSSVIGHEGNGFQVSMWLSSLIASCRRQQPVSASVPRGKADPGPQTTGREYAGGSGITWDMADPPHACARTQEESRSDRERVIYFLFVSFFFLFFWSVAWTKDSLNLWY